MAAEFTLEIVTPERTAFREKVTSLIIKASNGYLGVLARHAPLASGLDIGAATIRRPDQSESRIAINGGFLMVLDNEATVLTTTAEMDKEIDQARSEAALERARKRLSERKADWDHERADLAMKRAIARIKTLNP